MTDSISDQWGKDGRFHKCCWDSWLPIWKKEIIRNPNSYHGEKSILGTLRDSNVKAQIYDIYKTISENILMFLGMGEDYLNKIQKKDGNHKSLINVSTLKLSTSSPCSPSPLWGSEILKSAHKCQVWLWAGIPNGQGSHPEMSFLTDLSSWFYSLIVCSSWLVCLKGVGWGLVEETGQCVTADLRDDSPSRSGLHTGDTDIINILKVMGARIFTVGGGSQEHETRKTRINFLVFD